jgi:hypothetical protein
MAKAKSRDGWGGKRPGAGRKSGPNRATIARLKAQAERMAAYSPASPATCAADLLPLALATLIDVTKHSSSPASRVAAARALLRFAKSEREAGKKKMARQTA